MKSEAGTATLDTQALFNRFNTRLVVKQMDQYATVNFAYPQPQIAEKWIGDLLLSANTETIRLMQAAHTKKIALLRDKIARRELLYAKVRTETIRGIANDARQLSKILGIPINSSVFQAIGSSDRAFYDLHDELHALLPETLPLSSVVKTESGATASPHAVGPGALFIFLYALIAGTILGALAVMAWEYLSSLFGKRRSFAFGE